MANLYPVSYQMSQQEIDFRIQLAGKLDLDPPDWTAWVKTLVADTQQCNLLKDCKNARDLTDWNDYRKNHPDAFVFLPNETMTGWFLRWADLRGAVLIHASLKHAQLHHANLENALLIGANLTGAELPRASLLRADLNRAVLCSSNLYHADLSKVRLLNADLRAEGRTTDATAALVDSESLLYNCDVDDHTYFGAVPLDITRIDPKTKIHLQRNILRMDMLPGSPADPFDVDMSGHNLWRPQGDGIRIVFHGKETFVTDDRGFRYLEWLLKYPGRKISASDLIRLVDGELDAPPPPQAIQVALPDAIKAVRQRLQDPTISIEERDELEAWLQQATRPGSQPAVDADQRTKDYDRVIKAVDRALEKLKDTVDPQTGRPSPGYLPELGEHLEQCIHHKGKRFQYDPVPPTDWFF